MKGSPLSQRVERFTESVIREMTRLAHIHGAVHLAQGMPDFPAPDEIYEHILYDNHSQYSMATVGCS